ncbi:hypothetical protein ACG94V_09445 [Acinetobacter sp. ULE_I001]|uniref:hypothetical protein n=1 Tax=unclassified Acinetobacter TaxID=196816 RepID=UPI003AF4C561
MKVLKQHLSLTTLFICVLFSACQKHENNQKNETTEAAASEVAQTRTIEIPAVPQNCNEIATSIKKLEKNVIVEDLNDLNQLFKKCLASTPLKTRYQWQAKIENIYQKLIADASPEVFQYMTDTLADSQSMTAQQKQELYKKLKPREKYLVDHAKDLYLAKFYIGEGEYTFVQHPQYDLDTFAPYLEKSDQVYFKQIRKEYTGANYIMDAGLAISFDEVANRLLYWEKFNKDYPNNHFKHQVVENIEQYRSALFQGEDNTRTLWFDDDKIADEQAIKAIEKIAGSKTASSPTAQKFVNLINASETLWQQMPKPSSQYPEDNSAEQQDIRAQREAFEQKIRKSVEVILAQENN